MPLATNLNDRVEIYKFLFAGIVEILGIIFLACLIWIPCPKENQSMANIAIGFDTASIIGIPLAFVLGGNTTKKAEDGTSVTGNNNVVTPNEPTA